MSDLIVATKGTCGGRPRIVGRRITTENIAAWWRNGVSLDEMRSEYDLTYEQIRAALQYEGIYD